jgi:hypothetical protein
MYVNYVVLSILIDLPPAGKKIKQLGHSPIYHLGVEDMVV